MGRREGDTQLPMHAPRPSRLDAVVATANTYAQHVWRDHLRLVLFGMRYSLRPYAFFNLAASCVCVWLCAPSRLALSWDATFTVVVFGIIFPLTYSISENFRRRERCAEVIAEMKASALSLLWLHRDLDRGVRAAGDPIRLPALPASQLALPHSVAQASAAMTAGAPERNAFVVLHEFLASTRLYLTAKDDDTGRIKASYERALRALSSLSLLNEVLATAAGYTKGGEGGAGRAAQYTRYLLVNLEHLRILRSYSGSPHGMRFFCAMMAHVSPLLLAPYFRHFCDVADEVCAPGYFSAVLYFLVLTTLYSVSVDIEDLVDGRGLDDILFNLDLELREAALLLPFEAAPGAPRRSVSAAAEEAGAAALPDVWVLYSDCLGDQRSGALVEAPSERMFAHRDPSRRFPRVSAAEASACMVPATLATLEWDEEAPCEPPPEAHSE